MRFLHPVFVLPRRRQCAKKFVIRYPAIPSFPSQPTLRPLVLFPKVPSIIANKPSRPLRNAPFCLLRPPRPPPTKPARPPFSPFALPLLDFSPYRGVTNKLSIRCRGSAPGPLVRNSGRVMRTGERQKKAQSIVSGVHCVTSGNRFSDPSPRVSSFCQCVLLYIRSVKKQKKKETKRSQA